MKKFLMTLAFLLSMAAGYAQKPPEGLFWMSGIYDGYEKVVEPMVDKITKEAEQAEAKGESLSVYIERFNALFSKYTSPFTLNENATSKNFRFLKEDIKKGYLKERIEEKKEEADGIKRMLFAVDTDMYRDTEGVKRVDAIMEGFYIPLINKLKATTIEYKENRGALDYIIMEHNLWFDRINTPLFEGATYEIIMAYFDTSLHAIKIDLLKREKTRMKKQLDADFMKLLE